MKNPAQTQLLARACAVLLLSTLSGLAQDGSWEKLELPASGKAVWQDKSRTDGIDHEEPRLAADAEGRLYFSNASTLLIGSDGGARWEEYALPNVTLPLNRGFLLAAGGQGNVIWATKYSQNGGKSWETLPLYTVEGAFGSNRNGGFLMGGRNDQILRMNEPFINWELVYEGHQNFGYIYQFANSDPYNMAAMGFDAVYVSVDTGGTWDPLDSHGMGLSGRSANTMALEPRLGGNLWLAPRSRLSSDKALRRVNMLTRIPEMVAGFVPDSSVNVIRVSSDGAIWLGTWGQGVWVSRDEGKTFAAQNTGLNSVYVKALQETSDGLMFALTPTGLFRLRGTGSGVRPTPARRNLGPRKAFLYLPGLPGLPGVSGHGPGSPSFFLINGRQAGSIPLLAPKEPESNLTHKETNP